MIEGMVVGGLLGGGVVVLWSRTWPRPAARPEKERKPHAAIATVNSALAQLGFARVHFAHLIAIGVLAGCVVGLVVLGLTGAKVPSAAAAIGAVGLPLWLVITLARRRQESLRSVWPEAIDLVHSAVRAGLSLPEALAQLGERGPEALQHPFQEFARDYQATGDFGHCLDRLKARLSDPVADRIVEALRITRDVGGTDLGTLLRTLSSFLRDDARVRAELEARQSWTVNGAKLALVAPWAVLGMMILRPEAAQAYDSPAGATLIGIGAAVSVIAYRVMLMLARLPQDQRVLA